MTFHCVGYAGTYPFTPGQRLYWRPMHTSSQPTSSPLFFEQDMLPRTAFRDEAIPPLRIALCGMVWDGATSCYGRSFESLLALQDLLDTQWPACLYRLDGDFSFCYLSPNGETMTLYRSLTCTREVYYCVTDANLTWSTSPCDLFPGKHPTLQDVDREMVAIMAATGLADPERSVYHQRRRLPPGMQISFFPDRRCQTSYYGYVIREDNTHLPYPQAVARLCDYVSAAVARAFSGERNCHVFVSGGLDAAIVAYEAGRLGKDVQVHGYHWTWDLPMFQQEYQRAQDVARWCHLDLHPINFQDALEPGSDYLTSMVGLPLPYNHAFYTCFRETIAAVAQQSPHTPALLATGHLGDTLFQGDWADPFRLPCSRFSELVHTCRDIFSWYPRHEAWGVINYVLGHHRRDLQENFNTSRVNGFQSLLTHDAFVSVRQAGVVDYRERIALPHHSFEARLVAANLQSGMAFNAPLKTSILYHDALPQGVILRHPFADRQLHEFCLSLGPQHRSRWHGGQIYTKFLMRLAYVDKLPPPIIQHEIRTPYAAISEQFCLRNRHQLREIFDHNALLAQWNILNVSQVQEALATSEACQKHSSSLVRMAGVEMWLQGLTSHPRLPQQSASPALIVTRPAQSHKGTGVITLPDSTRAHLINGQCVLINTSTLEVARLDELGTSYWLSLLEEPSWTDVIHRVCRVTLPHESFADTQKLVYTFTQALIQARWIDGTHTYQEKEVMHAIAMDDRESLSTNTHNDDSTGI